MSLLQNIYDNQQTLLGSNGFKVISSATGIFVADFAYFKVVGGNAVFKAETDIGEDFSTDGDYSTGYGVTVLNGDTVFGSFTEVEVDSGLILGYYR